MAYKAVGRSITNYTAPVWSTNASNTSMQKIQVAQNEALRISTGAHKMSSIDHLHCKAQMLKVMEHSDLLSAQYLVKCLDHESVCHNITTLDQPPCMMKHTLYSKHHTTIAPLRADTTKESLKAVHTAAVSKSRRKQTVNRVLRDRPPDISETETSLRRPQRTTLPATLGSLPSAKLVQAQDRPGGRSSVQGLRIQQPGCEPPLQLPSSCTPQQCHQQNCGACQLT